MRGSGTASSRRSSASWPTPAGSTGRCGASTARSSGRIGTPRARAENLPAGEPADHALGRSRGGFTTKLHLVTDGAGLPLAVALSAGQAHESQHATRVLDVVRVPRRGPGRPRRRPVALAGDKGYSYPAIRAWLRQHGVQAVIPERADQIRWRAHRPGRKPHFDRAAYRRRSAIECTVGALKEARAVATRYEKLAIHYLALVQISMIRLLVRRLGHPLPAGA